MTKQELRKIYLGKRQALSEESFNAMNARLADNFFANVKLSAIHTLHTFLPIEKNREVNTWLIIDRLKKEFPDVRISVPRMNNQTAELEHYYLDDRCQLELNTWEIPEPVKGVPTPVEKIDAVLVPLLAFDRQGHRLGYGRGFYDRFLATCRPDCTKIGLSFFDMEERIEGIDDKDISLDMIITPESVFVV